MADFSDYSEEIQEILIAAYNEGFDAGYDSCVEEYEEEYDFED